MKLRAAFPLPLFLALCLPLLLPAQSDPSAVPYFSIIDPPAIAGLYQPGQYGVAAFGPGVSNGDVIAPVVVPMLDDPFFCDVGIEDFTGKIVLISRGVCSFSQKVINAEAQGAVGVIIWNFEENVSTMAFGGPDTPGVPSIMVPKSIGDAMAAQLAQGETVVAVFSAQPFFGFALIQGTVRADDNDNCVAETGEAGRKNWVVTAQNAAQTYVGLTNAAGQYKIFVDTADTFYTLMAQPPSAVWVACPTSQTANFTGPDTLAVNFSAQAQADCPLLVADIGTPFLRRCFENDFTVQICNYGSVAAQNAFADAHLDAPGFEPVSGASLPFVIQPDGAYRFQLGDLAVDECAQFTFKVTVSCDSTVVGQALCYAVHAYPDTFCFGPSASWSGASVSVGGQCDGDSVRFQIVNTGTAAMIQPRDYVVIDNNTLLQTGQFLLSSGEALDIVLPATGGDAYRVEAEQEPGHPVPGTPSDVIDGCGGIFGSDFFLSYPVYDGSFAEDVECQEVIGSWDPNDKIGYPLGVGPDHYIRPETELEYRIRFQNTGTDTAFTIVVRDTLSPWLDPATVQPGVSSHPYQWAINEGNQLVFRFDNIRLVDSFTNEPASHGFLFYKIRQQPDNPDGTVIDNRAGIYFDFNPAVLTNTTRHEIGELPQVGVGAPPAAQPGLLRIYPNPASPGDKLTVDAELPDGTAWRLFDPFGRLLQTGQLVGQILSPAPHGLSPGIYWLEFSHARTGTHAGSKLILR